MGKGVRNMAETEKVGDQEPGLLRLAESRGKGYRSQYHVLVRNRPGRVRSWDRLKQKKAEAKE